MKNVQSLVKKKENHEIYSLAPNHFKKARYKDGG